MDRALTVKIADFGLAGATLQHSGWGTPAFMAPELFEGRPYNGKVDVYAFGVLLNEMFTLQKPWSHDEPDIVKEAVLQGKRPDVTLSAPPGSKISWSRAGRRMPTPDHLLPKSAGRWT